MTKYSKLQRSMFHVPCLLFSLPCGIMVVRQILALNVRVQILAGQRENIEQGTRNDEVRGFDVRVFFLDMQHFDVPCSFGVIRFFVSLLSILNFP